MRQENVQAGSNPKDQSMSMETPFFRVVSSYLQDFIRLVDGLVSQGSFGKQWRVIILHFLLLISMLVITAGVEKFISWAHIGIESHIKPILNWTDFAFVFLVCLEAVLLFAMRVYQDVRGHWRELVRTEENRDDTERPPAGGIRVESSEQTADSKCAGDVRFQQELKEIIAERTSKMLSGLDEPSHVYHGDLELYNALTARMESLEAGDTVFAICGEKDWEFEGVNQYSEANLRKRAEGVQIKRIFYEMYGNVADEAQKQADGLIDVRLLRAEKLAQLKPIHKISTDLSIAIFKDSCVFLHAGKGANSIACTYECPQLAAIIRSEFESLEKEADPIPPQAQQTLDVER
jgi:hypothetical protein